METTKLTDEQLYLVLEEAFRRATHDKDFRNRCLENPKHAIHELSGKELPDNIEISFVESNKGNHIGRELDLDQLDSICGGAGFTATAVKRKLCFTLQ